MGGCLDFAVRGTVSIPLSEPEVQLDSCWLPPLRTAVLTFLGISCSSGIVVCRSQAGQDNWLLLPFSTLHSPCGSLREEASRSYSVQFFQVLSLKYVVSSAPDLTFRFWEGTKGNSSSLDHFESSLNSADRGLRLGRLWILKRALSPLVG